MTNPSGQIELILLLFDTSKQAGQALEAARLRISQGDLRLINAAVILKDPDGNAKINEIHDVSGWRGSLFGLVAGALVGLLAGPAGAVVGGALGAATGGAVAGGVDLGFSNEFLKELETALQIDRSLLLVLVEPPWDIKFLSFTKTVPGKVYRHLLKADVVEKLKNAPPPESPI